MALPGATLAGTKLGRYAVLRQIATGDAAHLLLAVDKAADARHVVLKRLRPELCRERDVVQSFLNEARRAAWLDNDHIVKVHEAAKDRGEVFFAMDYVHGHDLRRLLAALAESGEQLALPDVIAIGSAVAAALHHGHELGFVHRGLAPTDIIIKYDGNVVVTDFGIAKAALRSFAFPAALAGKVPYLAPEVCLGDKVDRRGDVFALGVILWELVTGRRLFKGKSDFLTMSAIVSGIIPLPRDHRPNLPTQLEAIILRALSASPKERYQTADELRRAIDRLAIDAGMKISTDSLADLMEKTFGDAQEPWLLASDEPPRETAPRDFDHKAKAKDDAETGTAAPTPVHGAPGSLLERARADYVGRHDSVRGLKIQFIALAALAALVAVIVTIVLTRARGC